MRLILVTLMYGVGALLGVQSVVIAVCFLVWNNIFRPAAFARYLSYLNPLVFPSHHLTFAVLMVAIFFTKWKKRWNTATTVLLVLLGWVWVCTIKAQHQVVAYEEAIEITKYLFPAIIMSLAMCTRRFQQIFVYTLAYSVGIWLAWHGFITLITGQPETAMAIPDGQMTDRNDFLVGGTACLPLLAYAAWNYVGPLQRWVRLGTKAMLAFSVVAFFTSLSRGAILGLTALTGFYALGTGRWGKRLPIAVVLLVAALLIMPSFVWDRLSTIEWGAEQTESSAASRVSIMLVAVDVTLDYPIFGVGPNNFPAVALTYDWRATEPHSLWLKASAEYGLTMLIFFIGVLVATCTALRRIAKKARRNKDKDTERLATALCCAIIGFLATGSFTSQFLSEYLWAIIGLSGAFIAAEKARAREAVKATAETVPPLAPAALGSGSS
jgi:putative inorganic carbon (HCO3(-)) transporter